MTVRELVELSTLNIQEAIAHRESIKERGSEVQGYNADYTSACEMVSHIVTEAIKLTVDLNYQKAMDGSFPHWEQ